MVELIINIESVNPIDFLGVNNIRLQFLKKEFPALKIIARGTQLKVSGLKEGVEHFKSKLNAIILYIEKNGSIENEVFQNIVHASREEKNHSTDAIILHAASGKAIKARTPNQQKIVEAIVDNDVIFAVGPAGTGKTYTAVALAVRALKNKSIKKIILTRPAVEAGESLGFLPGDLKEKIDPYLRPLYDALEDMLDREKLNYYLNTHIIEIAPLAYMRGRTLDHAYIILDEAQNTTDLQLKMFLTRLGTQAKAIITGDTSQIDLPYNQKSGLKKAIQILQNINGIAYVPLDEQDVVRHHLVKKIIHAYEINHDQEKKVLHK